MTTAYQEVFDRATTMSWNTRKKVAQTVSRNGTVRTTSLGGQTWQFEVQLPNGPKWSEYRPLIQKMEALDRTTVGQVQINATGQDYIVDYQGDLTTLTGIGVSYTSGNTVTITSGATGLVSGQYRFKAGDVIQLGTSGSVYSITEDVAHDETTITVHRPVLEAAGSYTLVVGKSVTWDVICVQFPQWELFGYDQVRWNGPFIFAESMI